MRVTLQDVAEEAGVSLATASRVLSGDKARLYVPSTRHRIQEAAKKLGYRPSFAARALATGRTSLATLWTYHPYHAFYATVVEAVQKEALKNMYGLLVADAAIDEASLAGPNACMWPSDGILAMDCGEHAERVLSSRASMLRPSSAWGRLSSPAQTGSRWTCPRRFVRRPSAWWPKDAAASRIFPPVRRKQRVARPLLSVPAGRLSSRSPQGRTG